MRMRSRPNIILQKGWRCLDCTVCEGCGLKHDEANLILCDECDISYHIYCLPTPLESVPSGTWKCKWCAVCHQCGTSEPGVNSKWYDNFSLCGPCHSLQVCSICDEGYEDGEMIMKCSTCAQWTHAECDSIMNEEDAEKCAQEGYNCQRCRPADALPPHLTSKQTAYGSGYLSQRDNLGMQSGQWRTLPNLLETVAPKAENCLSLMHHGSALFFVFFHF